MIALLTCVEGLVTGLPRAYSDRQMIDPPPRDLSLSVDGLRVDVLEAGRARHPGSWVSPESAVDEWLWSPINVVLVRGGGGTTLIDAGAGSLGTWWPHEGFVCDLETALARAGISSTEITKLVLTHLDFDHVGGAVVGAWPDELEEAFPGVPVTVLGDAVTAAEAADTDAPLNAATRAVAVLRGAGVLETVEDGVEITPGVRIRSAPGHRPGHALIEIGSSPARVVFIADILHHPVHAQHPEWDAFADEDVDMALRTRRAVLSELAGTGTRVFAAHIAADLPLTVRRDGEAWRFVPSQQSS